MKTFIVTGSAGFIGYHTSKRLLEQGDIVVGVDNMNDYYNVKLKKDRNEELKKYPNYKFFKTDICDHERMVTIYKEYNCEYIIHFAAQAGVRYSIKNPFMYQKSNIEGFLSILEIARNANTKLLVFASSSSVYGANSNTPFSVKDPTSKPVSFYGATKLADEVMAYSYHHLFNIPIVGLRFFTVYGPWGRPDMAYYKFTDAISHGKPIDVYNNGQMKRSFTYIEDAINGIVSSMKLDTGFNIFNIGNPNSIELLDFIRCIEKEMQKKAMLNFLPLQDGEMLSTQADIKESKEVLGFEPLVSIEQGIKYFINWYKEYSNKL